LHGIFTSSATRPLYGVPVMRRAFVIQLAPDTQPHERHYNGWIEEVDTGREFRFRSTDELLTFLGECFERARDRESQIDKESNG
jgi:hypothetical protein